MMCLLICQLLLQPINRLLIIWGINPIYKKVLGITTPMDVKNVGDNMVGFFSQIGWVGDNQNTTPEPRILMEKIFVDVDTEAVAAAIAEGEEE